MKEIIIITGLGYPSPENITVTENGLLGKTISFTEPGSDRTIHLNCANISAIKITDTITKSETPAYVQLLLASGASYQDVDIIAKSDYDTFGITDLFGDDQLAFRSAAGVYITRYASVASLTAAAKTRTVRTQNVQPPPA